MLYLSHNNGLLSSLIFNGKELLNASSPLFRICLRSKSGETVIICSNGADSILQDGDKTVFSGFSLFVTVFLRIENRDGKIKAYAEIKNDTDYAVEWVILLPLKLKPLCGDGGEDGTQLILPYNEGLLLDSVKKIPGIPPEYPSSGGCLMFPNMMFAQTASYLFKNGGSGCYLNIYTPDENVLQKK